MRCCLNFMPMYLDGTFSRISRQYIKCDGTATYVYDAVGLGRCRYDPEKTCNYCGNCFSEAGK